MVGRELFYRSLSGGTYAEQDWDEDEKGYRVVADDMHVCGSGVRRR
jgi:hypothetical protein